ncbi:uncharacterized protein [Nicotiana sylvestris]|uniref:uncharacterized protein n=1 Tax=Nicotiana sylvestris TaxID=4096 RepID=UPI00388CCD53
MRSYLLFYWDTAPQFAYQQGKLLHVGLWYRGCHPTEVEIPFLRIIQEDELSDAEWIKSRYEKLALIDGKRMNAVCHHQLYQNIMSKEFNKRVKPRQFAPGQLVMKKIFPHQDEAKGKFSPNWQGPYMVHRVLIGGTLILAEMDGEGWPKPVNSDAVKRYYA